MDKGEVQEIVEQTIRELKRKGLLKVDYNAVLKETDMLLREYFKGFDNDSIDRFLKRYANDSYIKIIYLHYRDSMTIEKIAEDMCKDVSTIKRNKKRLIMKLYETLEI